MVITLNSSTGQRAISSLKPSRAIKRAGEIGEQQAVVIKQARWQNRQAVRSDHLGGEHADKFVVKVKGTQQVGEPKPKANEQQRHQPKQGAAPPVRLSPSVARLAWNWQRSWD